jgi:DNA-binding response OmpR family regulator
MPPHFTQQAEHPGCGAGETAAPICPHCGYDLRRDEPMTIGAAHFDPTRGFSYRGQPIHLTPLERIFISTLMKSAGRWASKDMLIDRMGIGEARLPEELVRIYACRVRKALKAVTAACPFEAGYGLGYRWIVPAQLSAVA